MGLPGPIHEKPFPVELHILSGPLHPGEPQGLPQSGPVQQLLRHVGDADLGVHLKLRAVIVPHQEIGLVHFPQLLRVPVPGIGRAGIAQAGVDRIPGIQAEPGHVVPEEHQQHRLSTARKIVCQTAQRRVGVMDAVNQGIQHPQILPPRASQV